MFICKMLSQVAAGVAFAGVVALAPASAQESVKIGLILPMTGGQASTGKQIDNAVKLYMQQKGDTVAGKKIEIILKDDAAVPDNTKRLAQELIVNDKVNFIAGFGVTPAALAAAPLATQAKIPEIVMAAGTSIITERSPYIVRTSFTLAQSSTIIGDWAAKNGIKKVATLTSDYAPGNDALNFFKEHFTAGGGEIVEEVKVPLANPDFAPFLQRMKDAKPDAMFVFVPAGQGGNFMKQYAERGLDKSGIKVIGPGDVMDDDLLNGMGDAALGAVTAHLYSAAHPSAMNKEFVASYKKAFGTRPGFMAVSGYDGIHLIYEALKKTGGSRSIRKPATSCRTSTSARSRRSTANSTTSSSRLLKPSRTPARRRSDGWRAGRANKMPSFRGASETSEPGIHNPRGEYGFRACAKEVHPGMTA